MTYAQRAWSDQGPPTFVSGALGPQGSAVPNRLGAAERDALLLEHLPLVRAVAGKLHARLRSGFELEDLVNEGVLGLIDALHRFDPSRDTAFGAFARQRIAGAIYDLLRAHDWVPRSVRDRSNLLRSTRDRLAAALGRSPSTEELAAGLGVSEQRLARLEQIAQVSQVVSLEEPVGAEARPLGELVGQCSQVQEQLEARQQHTMLREAVEALPPSERTAVHGYYLENRPLREIADTIGVTEARVSQLHRQGVERLRTRLRGAV
jgi:RNA polymerase sigma factor for flagellar operon FliA